MCEKVARNPAIVPTLSHRGARKIISSFTEPWQQPEFSPIIHRRPWTREATA